MMSLWDCECHPASSANFLIRCQDKNSPALHFSMKYPLCLNLKEITTNSLGSEDLGFLRFNIRAVA